MFSAATKSAHPSGSVNWIDDVFSTYLYTGTGSAQTITNNIDLATKGGLTWFKKRDTTYSHSLQDTVRGGGKELYSNNTSAQIDYSGTYGVNTYNTNGFSLIGNGTATNASGGSYASWTFAKQAKFFDVVTYTGNNAGSQAIAHNLGATPGCVIIKAISGTGAGSQNWCVWHRGLDATNSFNYAIDLNSTAARYGTGGGGGLSAASSTTFTVSSGDQVNGSGINYVAYLFAHDAGGFGTAGTDNVISCGSFTTDSNGSATVNLGYEPQYLILKDATGSSEWSCIDNMRGFSYSGWDYLRPNSSAASINVTGSGLVPTATGFTATSQLNGPTTYIYIAIRRPMKPPTTGTEVFSATSRTGTGSATIVTSGFATDSVWAGQTSGNGYIFYDKLRGLTNPLPPYGASAEYSGNANALTGWANTGINVGVDTSNWELNQSGIPYITYQFRRASTFFDEVCYTGDGGFTDFNHNLNAIPELIICKKRSSTSNWAVQWTGGNPALARTGLSLNTTNSALYTNYDITGVNTKTTFEPYFVIDSSDTTSNASGSTYVAYLFATVAGVSKVGSYTGTGTTQQINCGFSGGARFVLIKRTDSTGDWYVWDTARGIVSGNDPYLLLNSTAAEVTGTDYVDTYAAGFEITSTAPAAINANGGNYIYLAIA